MPAQLTTGARPVLGLLVLVELPLVLLSAPAAVLLLVEVPFAVVLLLTSSLRAVLVGSGPADVVPRLLPAS